MGCLEDWVDFPKTNKLFGIRFLNIFISTKDFKLKTDSQNFIFIEYFIVSISF